MTTQIMEIAPSRGYPKPFYSSPVGGLCRARPLDPPDSSGNQTGGTGETSSGGRLAARDSIRRMSRHWRLTPPSEYDASSPAL